VYWQLGAPGSQGAISNIGASGSQGAISNIESVVSQLCKHYRCSLRNAGRVGRRSVAGTRLSGDVIMMRLAKGVYSRTALCGVQHSIEPRIASQAGLHHAQRVRRDDPSTFLKSQRILNMLKCREYISIVANAWPIYSFLAKRLQLHINVQPIVV